MLRLSLLLLAAIFGVAAHAAELDVQALRDFPEVRFPAPNRVVSGAISEAQLSALRSAGIRHVVNLRPIEENPNFDEARAAKALGLEYHAIPIEGAQSLTMENARALDRTLKEIGDEPALLHCSSGNRVGALIALREAWIVGVPVEQAIATGKKWGLTRLEQPVRALLDSEK